MNLWDVTVKKDGKSTNMLIQSWSMWASVGLYTTTISMIHVAIMGIEQLELGTHILRISGAILVLLVVPRVRYDGSLTSTNWESVNRKDCFINQHKLVSRVSGRYIEVVNGGCKPTTGEALPCGCWDHQKAKGFIMFYLLGYHLIYCWCTTTYIGMQFQ